MVLSVSLVTKLLNVKEMHINSVEEQIVDRQKDQETFTQHQWVIQAAPYKRVQCLCPVCKERCPKYDHKTEPTRWRGPNLGGTPLYIEYAPVRVQCKEHGIHTEFIPWQDGTSHFLAAFNDEVAYLATKAPKTTVAEFMDINWRTVGSCIEAAHTRLEPDVSERVHSGFTRICVDETSFKRGYKYMTVVIDMDRNTVVWLHEDHGDQVFAQFCELLTEEERAKITLICGDGARWIGRQAAKYFPNAVRCIDPFHVVTWAIDALDDVRRTQANKASREFAEAKKEAEEKAETERLEWLAEYEKYKNYKAELNTCTVHRGRPSKRIIEMRKFVSEFEALYGETMNILKNRKQGQLSAEDKARLDELEDKVKNIKGCRYAMGMAPENLNQYNADRLELIKVSNGELYAAYQLKEQLRVIVHMTDRAVAEAAMHEWIEVAKKSGFKAFEKLAAKIEGDPSKEDADPRMEGILNAIEYAGNSSRSEETNGRIKKLIHVANGFRNIEAMFSLIYLVCSDLVISLPNRYTRSAAVKTEMRKHANAKRKARQAAKAEARAEASA